MIGTAARAGLLLWSDPVWQQIAVPVINIVGSFLLGVVTGTVVGWDDQRRASAVRHFAGVGILGGFTTYSAFAVAATQPTMLPWAAVTMILGLAAAAHGLIIARRWHRRRA